MRGFAWLPVALLVAGCGGSVGETRTETHHVELDDVRQARIDLDMNAGELSVSGGAGRLLEAEFTYNVESWKPVVDERTADGRRDIKVSQPEASLTLGNTVSRWSLRVNDGVPVEIIANLGAGEANMNLGSLDVRNVEVSVGAGEVHVDLRGTPKQSYGVRISGGVGEAEVLLPRTVGISANASGGLGSINVDGLERRGERWINPGHDSDPVQISVDVQGGVGEVRLIAR
jgi:hypothetical protein